METQPKSYKLTIYACYVGFFAQAIVINLTPILFIPLRKLFGLSYEQLGLLVFINFTTQVICDLAFHRVVDKYGYRPFILAANIIKIVGFLIFATAPYLFSNPYTGFMIGTVIFSGAGGLFEVLLSPIVNSIPTDEKATAMSVLHSFYAWGQLSVILLTTLLLYLLGIHCWQWIILMWLLVPLVNFVMFLKAPLGPQVPDDVRLSNRALVRKPFFVLAFLAIIFGGASEQVAAQWTSAFLEMGMNIPKVIGDIAGVCSFALCLGIGRLIYGKYGHSMNLKQVMVVGSMVAMFCYIVIAFSHLAVISFIACMVCGLAVSLLWPGTLVLAAERYPLAGTGLFAMLAAGGDIGCALGPWMTGVVIETTQKAPLLAQIASRGGGSLEQLGLRAGMLAAAAIPLVAYVCLVRLGKIPAKADKTVIELPIEAR